MRGAFSVLLLLGWVLAAGCATFRPQPMEALHFKERMETQERDGLRVSVAVLSRDEARQAFGLDLYAEQIQPVWLRLENRTDAPYWFMLHGLDPNYFSTREAAYKSHYWLRPWTNQRMDAHFERLGIIPAVPPKGETSGFAFSNVKLGTKEVEVRLLTAGRVEDFVFYVSVPGFEADYQRVEWDDLAKQIEFVDLRSEAALFEALQQLPCCTTRQDGSDSGDPLNLARNYLFEDLLTTESIRSLALVDGVGRADQSDPRRNLMFAPYWTDGRRLVVRLVPEGEQIDVSQVDDFGDYRFGASIRKLEGMRLEGGSVVGPVEERDTEGDAAEGHGARE